MIAVHINQQQFRQVFVLKGVQAAFAVACFRGLIGIHEYSGSLKMAPSPLDKQTAGCNSPHDCLMSLALDLAACNCVRSENGSNRHHLAVFRVEVAFAYHLVATSLPTTLPSYRIASAIGYSSSKLIF